MRRAIGALCWFLAAGLWGAELRFALHGEPKTTDPLIVADESAEAIRYLTEGVLIRMNRLTQKAEPELAVSWTTANDGKKITFHLRRGVTFPDGSPFTAADVAGTFQKLLDPALHSPVADTFKSEKGTVKVSAAGDYTVIAEFPAPPPAFERLFDQVPIVSARASQRPAPGLGPFLVAQRIPGSAIVLKRNPSYWKRQAGGAPLPSVDSIRLEIQENRDLEVMRLKRGELHLIDNLTPELYERLSAEAPRTVVDSGPSLDTEFLWFNLSRQAPIADYKKAWFQSVGFRRAISGAVQRADLSRVVYRGHATPASSFVSPANKLWFKTGMKPDGASIVEVRKQLALEGFQQQGSVLRDRAGHAVEFSIVTNSGSKLRERMAAMIQQDLAQAGIRVNVVTLEFPSLIERITRTLNYETCLLGLVNIDVDPTGLMNVLLSSASNHPWSPSEKSPDTAWEAEIDRLMLAQASTANFAARKKAFDRVQEILHEQAPIVFLVHPNALSAVSPQVAGVKASAFFPRTFWDAEHLTVTTPK